MVSSTKPAFTFAAWFNYIPTGVLVSKRFASLCCGVLFTFCMAPSGFAQNVDFNSIQDVPSTSGTDGIYQRFDPLSITSQPDFFSSDSPNSGTDIKGNPGGLANINSVPNFSSSFTALGQSRS